MYEPPYPQGPGQPGAPMPGGQPPDGQWQPPGPWPPPPGGWHPSPPPSPPLGPGQPAPQPPTQPAVVADTLVSPTYGGWWLRGLAIVQAGWKQLVLIQLIAAAVAFATRAAAAVVVVNRANDVPTIDPENPFAGPSFGSAFGGLGLIFTGLVLSALVTILATLANLRLGLTIAGGGRPQLGDMFRFAAMRTLPVIGWGLLAGLIITAGVWACVVPGL